MNRLAANRRWHDSRGVTCGSEGERENVVSSLRLRDGNGNSNKKKLGKREDPFPIVHACSEKERRHRENGT